MARELEEDARTLETEAATEDGEVAGRKRAGSMPLK